MKPTRVGFSCLGLLVLTTCAHPGRPPGGPVDLLPPQVVETRPVPDGQMEDMGETVVLRFNERISERLLGGTLANAVLVSPEVPDLEISQGSDEIRLKAPGGWGARQVYRIRILPVIQDLFNNRMAAPFEFVFGTGMGFSESVIAGVIEDRITGFPVADVRVTARQNNVGGVSNLPLFLSVTDSDGIFSMRRMVPGGYDLEAFTDVNRNREADAFEPVGAAVTMLARSDTSYVKLTLLRPDTTRAAVGSIQVVDSASFEVNLDDFLDPEHPLDDVLVTISSDFAPPIAARRIVHDGEYQDTLRTRQQAAAALVAAERAAADTVDAATTVDTMAAPAALPVNTPAQQGSLRPPPRVLPKQNFFVLLADTLHFEVEYVVEVLRITNINGVPLGGGTDTIVRRLPPPPDSVAQPPPDSLPIPADSIQAVADTGGVRRR